MIKAPISLQELRRRIYRKAKSDKTHRFWGIFAHIAKMETLEEAYRIARRNGGAPGIDGQTFEDIEAAGLASFLEEVREELISGRYQPRRSPHRALAEVRRSVLRRMSTVIDVDLSRYFDTIRHSVLLDKIAKRVQDPQVLHLVKQILKAGGKIGVPQGGPFSPLAANIYLNEVDWAFDAIRRKTAQGPYEAVNYHRFADDIVITVSGHDSKRGWAARALQRLQEHLTQLGVALNH